ncbi:hypothetical protein GPJ56_009525 [Histomonas meleagridis]|uniref:uncharacterized protein n=1 Tax=Histomonas meleagridis TaxID=135588 RepID=UPI003559F43C|nr:hypothetical protein GPJ56_009525 [Histomonas meleagridis]KAH0802911.1 hypothetical protein GO595_004418 [Histomonas meleagridis]
MEADMLFDLQMRIKKYHVDHQRKEEEVKRLQISYDTQLRDYMYSLYVSAVSIWTVLNKPNQKELISAVDSQPSNVVSKAKLLNQLQKFQNDSSAFAEKFSKMSGPLTLNAFLCLLSVYNFLWSVESCESFAEFISHVDDDSIVEKLCQCLLVHPLIQNYFSIVISKAFLYLQNTQENHHSDIKKSVHILKAKIIKLLKKLQPLIPEFFRFIIRYNSSKKSLFFNAFLKPFILHHTSFGISQVDIDIFAKEEISLLIDSLSRYFNSSKAEELLNKITESPSDSNPIVCIIPSEKRLKSIYKDFQSFTLVNPCWLHEIDNDIKIAGSLCFLQLSSYTATQSRSSSKLSSVPFIAHNFLMKADLIKLSENQPNFIDYFHKIASISSLYGDPDLELEIERLYHLDLSKWTIPKLCKSIEEAVFCDTGDSASNGLLQDISTYSPQYAYISKLKELSSKIPKNVNNEIDLNTLSIVVQQYLKDPSNNCPSDNDVYTNPRSFLDLHKKIIDYISSSNLSFENLPKNLYIILSHHYRVLEHIKTSKEMLELDTKINKFFDDKKSALLDISQNDFLKAYQKNPDKLRLFANEFKSALDCNMPMSCIFHLHQAYLVLVGLLQTQDIDEVGADQIVPFALYATVLSNAKFLAPTYKFMNEYVQPFAGVLEPQEEYSITQFAMTYKYLETKMKELQ